MAYQVGAVLAGNRIHHNATGVVSSVAGAVSGLGFPAGSEPNEIFANTTGVNLTGQMQQQHVFGNVTGVSGSGQLVSADLDHANLIEANTTGVSFGGPIRWQRIAGNATGIVAVGGQMIDHNLIYRNTTAGVRVQGAANVRILQNTFYTPAGDNIRVTGGASGTEIWGNTLWTENGYDIYVANDSTRGFFSDYNNLHAGGDGQLVYWTKPFADILDWQQDVYQYDLHSIGATAVNPAWSEPRFVSRARDDYRVFPLTAGQRWSQPHGRRAAACWWTWPGPLGTRTCWRNPGFESGTADWEISPDGSAQGGSPGPFEGSRFLVPGDHAITTTLQTVDLLAAGLTVEQIDTSTSGRRVRRDESGRPTSGHAIGAT